MRRLIVLAAFAVPVQLFAGLVIYSNEGPGFPADSPEGLSPFAGIDGVSFVATNSGTLTQVQVGIQAEISNFNMPASLYTDSGGEPGTLLEGFMVPITTGFQTATVNSVVNPLLTAGQTYWFVIQNPADSDINWITSDEGVLGGLPTGPTLTTLDPEPTTLQASIALTGNATGSGVPEPSAAVMAVIGAVALAVVKLNRRG
jgi:hypothetical protein